MLDQQKDRVWAQDQQVSEGDSKTLLSIALSLLRRQFWLLVSSLAAALFGAAVFLYFVPTIYTATATLLIDARKGGIQTMSVLGDTPTDNVWIDSQMGILTLERDKIGAAVAKKLQLTKDPHVIEQQDALHKIVGWIRGEHEEQQTKSEAELFQRVAGVVSSGLEIRRVGLSYLVTVNYSSSDPQLALKIANAAANEYVAAEMESKYRNLREASAWLEDRYRTLSRQASEADRAVIEFKSTNNIVTAGGKLINDQQLTDINDRLTAARVKIADAQARLSQINAVLEADAANPNAGATVADALNNPIITRLRNQYLDLVNREADWEKRFGRDHLAVVNLRNQERDIQNSIREELKRIREGYKSDLAIAKKNEQELKGELGSVIAQIPNEAQISLRGLEGAAQSYHTFGEKFLQSYNEAVQQQSAPFPETRVIAYATYSYKSYPSPARIFSLALLGGLGLGVGVALIREMIDSTFRTSRQTQAALHIECLALIPFVRPSRPMGMTIAQRLLSTKGRHQDLITDPRSRRIISDSKIYRLVSDNPFSRFAESIRAIKLAADSKAINRVPEVNGKVPKVIGITSTVSQEGKSTIAAALAGLIAQVDRRVILIDGDLRNPSLSRSLAPDATVGLLEVISGAQSLDKAIWNKADTSLAFLPSINSIGVPNTDQILGSEPMKLLFDVLRSNYEYIIVDLAPLAPIVDVRATTSIIDFYVYVIEWGVTQIDSVRQALSDSHDVYENILGVALNKVDMRIMKRYENQGTTYYNEKYYKDDVA